MQQQISIATSQDLLAALNHQEMSVRAATLKAVAAAPEKAVSVCIKDDVDLFAELEALGDRAAEPGVKAGYLLALFQLDDKRRMDVAKKVFLAADDARIILLAAEQIARLPEQERTELLTPVLMAADAPTKSRAAANLLAGSRSQSPQITLRLALLSDHGVPAPPLDTDTLSIWLQELQGPYALTARRTLKKTHRDGAAALLPFWKQLPDELCVWMLGELSSRVTAQQRAIIGEILTTEKENILLGALEWLKNRAVAAEPEEPLQQFYRHDNPLIRTAAIHAGSSKLDWSQLFAREKDDRVRQALIRRIGISRDQKALPLLATLADDANWRIRAGATAALVDLSPDSLQTLQTMLSHPSERVRSCAIQALTTLNRDDIVKLSLAP